MPAVFIEWISETNILVHDSKHQPKILTLIPGIGLVTAIVVLTVHEPANYAVGDQDMVAALIGNDRDRQFSD